MRVVIGGQLGKEEIRACVESSGIEGLSVEVKDDVSAAMDIKQGRADYYLGACLTGGGGALAMAIAILGYDACKTLDSADAQEVALALDSGARAFGFTPQLTAQVVPVIMSELAKRA